MPELPVWQWIWLAVSVVFAGGCLVIHLREVAERRRQG